MRYAIALACLLLPALAIGSGRLSGWGADQRLTANDSDSYTSRNSAHCVAAARETVHVAWFDRRDGNWEIYYKRSLDSGATWSSDTRLTNDSSYSRTPSLAVTGPLVHLAWHDFRGGNREIYYKRSTNGGLSWDTDVRLTQDTAESYNVSLAASGAYVHVAWMDRRDGNLEVYYKRSGNQGATWLADVRLTNDPSSSYNPSIVATGTDVHVAWCDKRDGNWEIYYKRSTNSGALWGADVRLTSDAAESDDPCIVAAGSSVHVAWYDYRDGNWEIYYKRSTDAGATWGPDTRLTDAALGSTTPALALNESNIHLAWIDTRDDNLELYHKMSTDGGATWGDDERLTEDASGTYNPSIAVDVGYCHVVWYDYRDGAAEIYYKRGTPEPTAVAERGTDVQRPRLPAVVPNPFTRVARVPGCESQLFDIRDASGRLVAVASGSAIGAGLAPGIYFICAQFGRLPPVRITKTGSY